MGNKVRIQLTQEQQDQIRKSTGKEAEALELNTEELEERIAPRTWSPRIA